MAEAKDEPEGVSSNVEDNEDEGRRRAEEALVKFPLRKTGSEPVLSAGKATSGASGPTRGGAATAGGARPKYPRRAYSVKQQHLSGSGRMAGGMLTTGNPVDVDSQDDHGRRRSQGRRHDAASAVAQMLQSSAESSPTLARSSCSTSAKKSNKNKENVPEQKNQPNRLTMAQTKTAAVAPSTPESVRARERVVMMHDQSLMDWQLGKTSMADRGAYLLETGLWSDCQFTVGVAPHVKTLKAHRMILAMASPVFEAMFFGGLAQNDDPIKILDVQPDAFKVMLQYIYTDHINLSSFELVCDICYAAKKYMLPALVEECTKFLWRDLYPRNACRAYEFAQLFEENVLMDKGLQIIRTQTREILSESTFEEVDYTTLVVILSQDEINADESTLFDAMVRWAGKECERRALDPKSQKRTVLKDALFLVRYLTFAPAEFAAGPARSDLLTQEESFAILMNISAPGSWELPEYLSKEREPRKLPRELLPAADVDLSSRYWCKRAMMQEPHCLNTSILDCSVTFTVDKDMCIHGIEVPSQTSEIPPVIPPEANPPAAAAGAGGNQVGGGQQAAAAAQAAAQAADVAAAVVNAAGTEYNELLYAHLLDAEGNRLTYTHFTAKVPRNSMIEITFNRSVYIKANKVYRVGMVLNKVGWYPMGVCTRRVNSEGCFFTFCVGQPTDTQRDGLIRSIIFSK